MFKHILVPTDGSELSAGAVRRAVQFAKEADAKITFYFAKADYPVAAFGPGMVMDASLLESFAEIQNKQAEQILSACANAARDAGVTCAIASEVNNVPYEGIINAAVSHGCDLIFMASHGRRGLNGLLLGSETHRVLTHTSIPVLVHR